MNAVVYQTLRVLVTLCFLGAYVLLLVDFRQPEGKWRLRWLLLAGGITAVHVALVAGEYLTPYDWRMVLTLMAPYTLATVWCSRYRGLRTVFSVANGFYVGCICGVNGHLVQALVPASLWLPLLVRVLSLAILYVVLRRFAKTCRQMLRQLDHGWLILCLIPVTASLMCLYMNQLPLRQTFLPAAVVLYGLLVVCICAYYLMYLFFERIQKETETQNDRKLLNLQVSALESRMEAVHAAEEVIRTERHDLRHRLQAATELVARGERETALDFLNAAQKRLDEQQTVHWCRPPVLDAMFASCFDQARRQGIQLEVRIALPGTLPVDEGELAIVLANALENAIHANRELPPEQRKLRCRIVSSPGIMIEISNPCSGTILFDGDGLPVATQAGHGVGTRSISAFCQKYGAVSQFRQIDGWFRLRLVL